MTDDMAARLARLSASDRERLAAMLAQRQSGRRDGHVPRVRVERSDGCLSRGSRSGSGTWSSSAWATHSP